MAPNGLHFQFTTDPDPEQIASLRASLQDYNANRAGTHPRRQLAVFARNAAQQLVGGVSGEVQWGWLYVDLLWVHERWRGRGVGSRLLRQIEHGADDLDVVGYHLGTTSFQALGFYQRHGYRVWGELQDFPPGHTNYSLSKRRGPK